MDETDKKAQIERAKAIMKAVFETIFTFGSLELYIRSYPEFKEYLSGYNFFELGIKADYVTENPSEEKIKEMMTTFEKAYDGMTDSQKKNNFKMINENVFERLKYLEILSDNEQVCIFAKYILAYLSKDFEIKAIDKIGKKQA